MGSREKPAVGIEIRALHVASEGAMMMPELW